jgi:perosamine synthetase
MEKLAIFGGSKVFNKECEMLNKFGKEEKDALERVVENGCLSAFRGGKEVRGFEKEFAEYVGTNYAVAATSGTAALHTSLASLNLPIGSEVAVPALTFVSTASVVLQEKLKPIFIDIDENYCMDPEDLKRKITNKTKAVIPVHIYGHPAKMNEINAIAKENEMYVIEDACQSHGAIYMGKKTGNLGHIGCFSFFETKNMTCGEGGMITCNDEELAKQIWLTKEHGSPRNSNTWYSYIRLGYNYNMTEMQGAIGRTQLKKLDFNNDIRIHNGSLYRKYLLPLGLEIASDAKDVKSVYHNMPVLLPEEYKTKRDFFVQALRAEGVPVDIAYPQPLYKTKLFTELGYGYENLPKVEDVTARMFTLFTDSSINKEIIINSTTAIEKVLEYLKKS